MHVGVGNLEIFPRPTPRVRTMSFVPSTLGISFVTIFVVKHIVLLFPNSSFAIDPANRCAFYTPTICDLGFWKFLQNVRESLSASCARKSRKSQHPRMRSCAGAPGIDAHASLADDLARIPDHSAQQISIAKHVAIGSAQRAQVRFVNRAMCEALRL